jgi:Copine
MSSNLLEMLEFEIECTEPFVVDIYDLRSDGWSQIGADDRQERQNNGESASIRLFANVLAEVVQPIRVRTANGLEFSTTLQRVVATSPCSFLQGRCSIVASLASARDFNLQFALEAFNLKKTHRFFAKPRAFVVVSRRIAKEEEDENGEKENRDDDDDDDSDDELHENQFVELEQSGGSAHARMTIARTERALAGFNAAWQPLNVNTSALCSDESDFVATRLSFDVLDWHDGGLHRRIGRSRPVALQALLEGGEMILTLEDDSDDDSDDGNGDSDSDDDNGMRLMLSNVTVNAVHSFFEYLLDGWSMRTHFAVDMTVANGDPLTGVAGCAHHTSETQPNRYVRVMSALASVAEQYGALEATLYGALAAPFGAVSHCAPLNGQPNDASVPDAVSLLDAYRHALPTVKPAGPPLLAQTIRRVVGLARRDARNDVHCFHQLIVLANADAQDVRDALDELVDASHLPMSVLFVGVGGADLPSMHVLDATRDALVSSAGEPASRAVSRHLTWDDANPLFARHALAHLVPQFLGYMQAHSIVPSAAAAHSSLPPRSAPSPSPSPSSSSSRTDAPFDTRNEERQHDFYEYVAVRPVRCNRCAKLCWGSRTSRCRHCRAVAHAHCLDRYRLTSCTVLSRISFK